MASLQDYVFNLGPKVPATDLVITKGQAGPWRGRGSNPGGGAPAYNPHMGSFSVIARAEASGTLTAVADPRRCAVADGIGA